MDNNITIKKETFDTMKQLNNSAEEIMKTLTSTMLFSAIMFGISWVGTKWINKTVDESIKE